MSTLIRNIFPVCFLLTILKVSLDPPVLRAQTAGNNAVKIEEISTLADFETAGIWTLKYRPVPGISGTARISDLVASPIPLSRHYLSISFTGSRVGGSAILPKEPLSIRSGLRTLRFWIYGFGQPDELYVDLLDTIKVRHRLSAGRLNFTGWKMIMVSIPPEVCRRPPSVRWEGKIEFLGFYLIPHFQEKPGLSRLFLDQLEAVVRPSFLAPEIDWNQ